MCTSLFASLVASLVVELCDAYALKEDFCLDLLGKIISTYPEARGETLIYRLYENKELCEALHARLLPTLEKHEEGISPEILNENIPEHLKNTTIAEGMLINMEQQGEL